LEVKLNKQRKLVVYDHDEDDNLLDYKIYWLFIVRII
jgi:hypothetical protein